MTNCVLFVVNVVVVQVGVREVCGNQGLPFWGWVVGRSKLEIYLEERKQ